MEYPRSNGRIHQHVILAREFYDSGVLFDPYQIDRIEIWRGQYSLEHPELLEDTIYGSKVVFHDVANNAYETLGLVQGTETTVQVGVLAYEQDFVNETDFIVTHNLTDDRPNVVVYDTIPSIIQPDNIIALDENNIRIVFATPQSGTIKVYGTEELSSSTVYTVNKYEMYVTGQDPVTVVHNLNDNDPRVVIYDTNGYFIVPNTITIVDDNTLIVDFGMSFSGSIVVMGGVAGSGETSFGISPIAVSTRTEDTCCGFNIFLNSNDKLALNVDGTTEYLTLTPGARWSVDDIVGMINAQWTVGVAYNDNGYIKLVANVFGNTHSLKIESVMYNGADDLGFVLGTYYGIGFEPALVEGSKVGPYTIVSGINDKIKLQINRHDPIEITLLPGVQSITNVVNEINDALTLANYPAIALEGSTGKLIIQSTTMDGIIRDSIGKYHISYLVPDTFLSEGLQQNVFKDVWYYKPNSSYATPIPDDTCCFRVYPENYFVSCGFNNYSYSFKLLDDTLISGEIKDIIVNVIALPEYNTPDLNDWLLPISDAEYYVATYGGQQVSDWQPVTLNTGDSLKIRFDTTSMQDGAYKMRVKLKLPEGQILVSGWLRLNVVGGNTL